MCKLVNVVLTLTVRLSTDVTERASQNILFYHSNVKEIDRVWYDHAKCGPINPGGGDHCQSAWKILR